MMRYNDHTEANTESDSNEGGCNTYLTEIQSWTATRKRCDIIITETGTDTEPDNHEGG